MKKLTYQIIVVLSATLLLGACASPATTEVEVVEEATEVPVEEPTEEPKEEPTEVPTEEPTDLPEPTPEPIVVTDDLGEEVVLAEPAQRIVSLSPSITESLFDIGAGDLIVGRDAKSNYPEETQEIESVGSLWEGLPTETILALEPDLVIVAQIVSPEQVQELKDLDLNVYWQANPEDFQGLYDNLMDLATLTGKEEAAQELVTSLQDRVTAVEEKLADVEESPLVYYELDATDPVNPWTPGPGTFISYIINKAEGLNLGDAMDGAWVQLSSEEIITQNPDIIILADALFGITPEGVAERPGWDGIKAVEEEQVFPFEPILSVPGPRLVDGFEQLAEILHPEVFDN
ncbi:MAG: Vitamin B12-binding protein [Chloroflexi bacterium]|nr:Vitamin B12-binding protein [Chloroflexota bacterium]